MQRRYNFAHLFLSGVVVLGLTLLMVCVDAQAQIVFSSKRDGNWEIYVMDADGKNQQNLSNNPGDDKDPSWSPNGKRVAFVSNREGNYEIYVINADGARQVRRRTKDGSDNTDPAWFAPAFAVEIVPFAVGPVGKKSTMWGWLKQVAP